MRYLLATLAALLLVGPMFGQVREAQKSMTNGTQNSYSVTLEGVPTKEVQKMFISKLKDAKAKKPKADRKTGYIFGDNARLPSISINTVDVYGLVDEQGDRTEVTVWFDLGGAYLSSRTHPDKSAAGKAWMTEFEREVKVRAVEIRVDEEEDTLKDLNKELEKLAKEEEKLHENVKDYEAKIEAAKKEIEAKVQEQTSKKAEIETQQKVVEETKALKSKID